MSDDHGHDHGPHAPVMDQGRAKALARRARAIEALLAEKGYVTHAEIRREIDDRASRSPADGARLVARAWMAPAFKSRLLADAKAAAAELGLDLSGLAILKVVENTDRVHHMVVCTLCSCYPRMLLGLPPDWYKSLDYRSRAVSDPRGVLREFGLTLPERIEVRVLDSTADMRYLVIPRRPDGTHGMTEAELASLVTRDSMIGVAEARQPAHA
ncbi:MAG TPA: nitrile hydratase subunit alpha [Methylomirabilota bacterium]|nr:nitrile hydratase subunit alpha [Methylomirabilota bacterium]